MRAILLKDVPYGIMEEFDEYSDVQRLDSVLASDGKTKRYLTSRKSRIEKTGTEVIEDVQLDIL